MRLLLPFFCFSVAWADPGWGLVEDSRGNIYFGDVLRNVVWHLNPTGQVNTVATGRHAHALCLDERGALWGDHTDYDPQTQKFSRSAWKLEGNRAVIAPLPSGRCQALFHSRRPIPKEAPTAPNWEIWAAVRSGNTWLLLEHAPANLFESLMREKKATTRLRRAPDGGASQILLER